MSYPFVAAWYDGYGARKGPTLGLLYHMAEGGGTVGYLDKTGRPPSRGVSVHAVCDYAGVVTRMLPWTDASGSLNPADRSTDKAYYGHRHLHDVLGDWWIDPNSVTLSMEIEGFAAKGPNADQIIGAIAWGRDMIDHFPELRGALGHADQTDTKHCPGTTAAMQAIFAGVGGHGLWSQEELVKLAKQTYLTAIVPLVGRRVFDAPGGKVIYTTKTGDQFGEVGDTGSYHVMRMAGDIAGYIAHGDVGPTVPLPVPGAATYPVTVGGKPVGEVTLP